MQRIAVLLTILALLMASGCRRETADPDMAAANATTATTDTSGTLTQTTTGATAGAVSAMAPADKEFVIQAAQAGMAEVMLSEPVLKRSQNPQVREFAQRMITDHGRGNEELQRLATNKGLGLPTTLEPQHQQMLDKLQGLEGASLDRTYMGRMIEDHQKVIAQFEQAERSVQDSDVRGWISRTLPTLREHLQHAQKLQTGLA